MKKRKDMRKPTDIKKRAADVKQPTETELGEATWWQKLLPWILTAVVLIWGVSLVTVTVKDALRPPALHSAERR